MSLSIQAERSNPCTYIENKCNEGIQKTGQYLMQVKRGWDISPAEVKVMSVVFGSGITFLGTIGSVYCPLSIGLYMGYRVFTTYKNRHETTSQALVKAAVIGALGTTPAGGVVFSAWVSADEFQDTAQRADAEAKRRV